MPHGIKQGLKRALWPHSLFAIAGIGIKAAALFLPTPVAPIAWAGFVGWRIAAEIADYRGKRDTGAKAGIDLASQVGWAVVGSVLPL